MVKKIQKQTLEIEVFFDHPSPVWEFSQLFFRFFCNAFPQFGKLPGLSLTITFYPENRSKLKCSKVSETFAKF